MLTFGRGLLDAAADLVAVAVTRCVPPPVAVLGAFVDGLDRHLAGAG